MKNDRGMISFELTIEEIKYADERVRDFFVGKWAVSHNYDFYVLNGGDLYQGNLLPDRTVTVCIIRHGYKFYSGCAIYKPGDRNDVIKGQQVAFGRCLDAILFEAQMTTHLGFSKYYCKELRRAFWNGFREQL